MSTPRRTDETTLSREDVRRADTSRYSYYVDPAFYERLIADLARWDEHGLPVGTDLREECTELLYREARLLDEARFEEWLELFTSECLYWLPGTPGGGDPRTEVTLAFDDRRRLEDRVYWLRTGFAYSQIPASRTRRLVTNMEAFHGSDPDEIFVRSNFVVFEFRVGIQRALPGWYGHRLSRVDGAWRIAVKQVNLIDSEHGHENLTIIF